MTRKRTLQRGENNVAEEPKAATPREELFAENARRIAELSEQPGLEGAFYRLCALLDTNVITQFMIEEFKRPDADGGDATVRLQAVGQCVGYMIAAAAGSVSGPPYGVAQVIIQQALYVFSALVSGEAKAVCVVENIKNGTLREAAVDAVLQGKMDKGEGNAGI
jgi:hypothetical protein